MTDILMPALSPTMEEGTLSKWNIKVGDQVSAGDVVAEIETDKATMEVEAVDEGVVEALLVDAGTEGVKVNTPIARLSEETSSSSAALETDAPTPIPGAASADPRAARDDATDAVAESPASARPESKSSAAPIAPGGAKSTPAPAAAATDTPAQGSRIAASPLARRAAASRGVRLEDIKGTGPNGRIVLADIPDAQPAAAPPAAATLSRPAEPEPAASIAAPVRSLAQMGIPDGSYDLVPHDGMRRTIARRMTDSFRDIPHFPLSIDLEIDTLLDARSRLNAALTARNLRVSVNDLVIKAAAAALVAVPEANASYTPEGRALHHHADIAVAVAVDGGLITPIVRSAETKRLAEIALEMKDLAERARTKKLKTEEFQGGTFSISNLGMFGIRSFASIINEPQGAILSVGAGEKRAVVRGEQIAIATVMSVTLTCDHRVVDGAIGARWLRAFKGFVEDPITLLA